MASSKWGPDPSTNDPTKMAQASMNQMSQMWESLGSSAQNANKRLKEERDYQDEIKYNLRLKEAQINETIAEEAYKKASAIKAVNDQSDKSFSEAMRKATAIGSLADDYQRQAERKDLPDPERHRLQGEVNRLRGLQKQTVEAVTSTRNTSTAATTPSPGSYTGNSPFPVDKYGTDVSSIQPKEESEGEEERPMAPVEYDEQGASSLEEAFPKEEDRTKFKDDFGRFMQSNSLAQVEWAARDAARFFKKGSPAAKEYIEALEQRAKEIQEGQAAKTKQTPADQTQAVIRDIEMSDLTDAAKEELKQYRYDHKQLKDAYEAKLNKLSAFSAAKYQAALKSIEVKAKMAGKEMADRIIGDSNNRVEFTTDSKGEPQPKFTPDQLYRIRQAEEKVRLTKEEVTTTFNAERADAGGKPLPANEPVSDAASELNPALKNATPLNLR